MPDSKGLPHRNPRCSSRWSASLLLAFLALSSASPQVRGADPEDETSRELEARFRMDPETRLHALVSLTRDNLHSFREAQLGIALDKRVNPAWSYRLGMRYFGTSDDSTDSTERRGVADLSYRWPLPRGWALASRSRADLRWISDKPFSSRLRERLMIEKTTLLFDRSIGWYGSYEFYYDSRYDRTTRRRAIVGVSVPVTRMIAFDLFYSRTREVFPTGKTTASVGFALGLFFGEPAAATNSSVQEAPTR
jgi:hypothetical protein